MGETEVPTFWSLLRESVIFQGLLVLMLGAAYVYMLVTGASIPADFSQMMGVVIGFFFGGKLSVATRAAAQETLNGQVRLVEAQTKLADSVKKGN
jgi:hypothetical protein